MPSERRQFARALRKHATKAEDILWAQLRASRFHGAKFRRQTPLDRYVADFYCHAAKLAIQLDGRQHEWFADYDAGRTAVIENFRDSRSALHQRRGLRRTQFCSCA